MAYAMQQIYNRILKTCSLHVHFMVVRFWSYQLHLSSLLALYVIIHNFEQLCLAILHVNGLMGSEFILMQIASIQSHSGCIACEFVFAVFIASLSYLKHTLCCNIRLFGIGRCWQYSTSYFINVYISIFKLILPPSVL